MFFVPSVGFASGYVAQPVHFDGVADYLLRSGALTGAADTTLFTGSFWVYRYAAPAAAEDFFVTATTSGGSTVRVRLNFQITNYIRFFGVNTGGTTVLDLRIPDNSISPGAWHHVCFAFDMADVAKRLVYVDDVSQTLTVTTYTNSAIDWTILDASIGSDCAGGGKSRADFADFWMAPGVYIDLSVTANRRKFISGGKPVFLGLDGSKPTGSTPLVFMSQTKDSDTWVTNKGTGGGFTDKATLTRSQTSPSNGYTAPAYIAEPVFFDGTNDYLTRAAGFTGAVDGKTATCSFWIKKNVNGVQQMLSVGATTLAGGTERYRVQITAGNAFEVRGFTSADVSTLQIASPANSLMADGNWHHVCYSFDLTNAANRYIYIDDVQQTLTVTTFNNNNIDYTLADWAIGAGANGANKFTGDLADFWLDTGFYLDLTTTSNRRKFINANLTPVDLGEWGELPGFLQPDFFFSGDTSTWETNDGTGGGFTLHGAIASSLTSPSPGYDFTDVASIYDLGVDLSEYPDSGGPQDGGSLFVNSQLVGFYDYTIKDGPVTISSFLDSNYFSSTPDSKSTIVVIKGDLTINAGQVFKPANRKLFTAIYVTGNCAINGEISMSARGANHSVTGSSITAAALRIINGTYSSVVNPQVPAAGAAGAGRATANANDVPGNTGSAGTAGQTGGGGSGGAKNTSALNARSGLGAAGTSFSGGPGSGAVNTNVAEDSPDADLNGGAGGAGQVTGNNRAAAGGAGNPGGVWDVDSGGNATDGLDGTGGTLVVIVEGTLSGSGTLTAAGAAGGAGTSGSTAGGAGGAGSGGGSVTVLSAAETGTVTTTALGGPGGASTSSNAMAGGAGGAGTARKLVLPSANITFTDESSSGSAAGSYTFSSQAIGAAASDRYIIVGAGCTGNNSSGVSSITVAGQSTTKLISGETSLFITNAPVTTGTTATIVLDTNQATRADIGVWRMTGGNPSVADTASSGSVISNGYTASLTIPKRGGAVGYVRSNMSRTYTWTNMNESFDADIASSGDTHTGALFLGGGTAARTVTASADPDPGVMVLAAFGPVIT